MTLELPQGVLMVGRFAGVKPVVRKATQEPVPGMFSLEISVDGREWPLRATFFSQEFDGEETRIQRMLDKLAPVAGELVAVRIATTASVTDGKAYVNNTPTAIYSLDENRAAVLEAAAANGKKA